MTQRFSNEEHGERDSRLDSLKGFAILLVLWTHLLPVRFEAVPGQALYFTGAISILIYDYLVKLAVPCFYLVALYLFYSKNERSPNYTVKRIRRVAILFVVWFVVYRFVDAASDYARFRLTTLPALVVSDGSLYFLFDLAILTLAAYGLRRVCGPQPTPFQIRLIMIAMVAYTFALGIFEVLRIHVPFWSVVGFIPYVGLALLYERRALRLRWLASAAASALLAEVALVVSDVLTWNDISPMQGYARPVVIFAAAALFLIWPRMGASNWRWMAMLGRYSLGIFVVHPLIWRAFARHLPAMTIATSRGSLLLNVSQVAVTLSLTALTVLALASVPKLKWLVA